MPRQSKDPNKASLRLDLVGDDKLHFEKFMEKHGLSVNTEALKLLMSYGYEYDRLVAKAKIEVPAR